MDTNSTTLDSLTHLMNMLQRIFDAASSIIGCLFPVFAFHLMNMLHQAHVVLQVVEVCCLFLVFSFHCWGLCLANIIWVISVQSLRCSIYLLLIEDDQNMSIVATYLIIQYCTYPFSNTLINQRCLSKDWSCWYHRVHDTMEFVIYSCKLFLH
jgi:hypothetical protein